MSSNSKNLRDPSADAPKLVGKHIATTPRFDDWRRPVETVEPDIFTDDQEDEPNQCNESFSRRRAIIGLLDLLTQGTTRPRTIGLRVVVLRHSLKHRDYKTQCELAESLGISAARLSQISTELLRSFGMDSNEL